jgi:hypothetical protein
MKTILITSIGVFALTSAAIAHTWTWFHGDIGITSPFVSSSSPAIDVTARAATKPKPVSKRVVAATKSKPKHADKRITAR